MRRAAPEPGSATGGGGAELANKEAPRLKRRRGRGRRERARVRRGKRALATRMRMRMFFRRLRVCWG